MNLSGRVNIYSIVLGALMFGLFVVGYTLEYLRGEREEFALWLIVGVTVIALVSALILYARASQDEKIKYIVYIGFFIIYVHTLFTAQSPVSFAIILPVLLLVFLYNSLRFTLLVVISIAAINIYYMAAEAFDHWDDTVLITQGFILAGFLLGTYFVSNVNMHSQKEIEQLMQKQRETTKYDEEFIKQNTTLTKEGQELASQVLEKVAETTELAAESKDASRRTESNSQENLNHLKEINGAVSELSETAQDIATNAEEVASSSAQVKEHLDSLVTGIDQISENTNDVDEAQKTASETYAEVSRSIGEIEQFTSDISDISAQTNLLALNAMIEAARAGEAGTGFAVVADEVRKLAEQSEQATEEIKSTIQSVVERNQQAEKAISQIHDPVEKTNAQVSNMSAQVREIQQMMQAVDEKMQGVASGAEEQSASIQELESSASEVYSNVENTVQEIQTVAQHNETQENKAKEIEKEIQELNRRMEEITKNSNEVLSDKVYEEYENYMYDIVSEAAKKPVTEVAEKYDIDTLNITDETGKVVYSNFEGSLGLAFKENEQTRPFYDAIIANKESIKVQPYIKRTIDNKLFQYIALPRKDQEGIVQIGINMED